MSDSYDDVIVRPEITEYPDWHAEYKEMELMFHEVKTEYTELAYALGFERSGWFDDPFEPHSEILALAKEASQALKEKVAPCGWIAQKADADRFWRKLTTEIEDNLESFSSLMSDGAIPRMMHHVRQRVEAEVAS